MKDPLVFYNKEDLWNVPNENYAGNTVKMEPYYITSNLPGSDDQEFILMLPFTPATRNNMISWMAGRSDGDNYGELILYQFPKDTLVYGPSQIESRIDQDSDISQLLSLWSQRGSRVIRGNLLVIPIERSILYVEPLYLQAETSELPELKRVIVAYGGQIVMRENLEQALEAVFGVQEGEEGEVQTTDEAIPGLDTELPGNIKGLATRAFEVYQEAQDLLRQGEWQEYGERLERLNQILEELKNTSEKLEQEVVQ
ncbi:MAG: UPF0182 family protein [Halanaerobiales bacterium]|nr:UPF0182 family protein [Halanaerobiales bacterium]